MENKWDRLLKELKEMSIEVVGETKEKIVVLQRAPSLLDKRNKMTMKMADNFDTNKLWDLGYERGFECYDKSVYNIDGWMVGEVHIDYNGDIDLRAIDYDDDILMAETYSLLIGEYDKLQESNLTKGEVKNEKNS